MRNYLLTFIIFLIAPGTTFSQVKISTKTGTINFEASVPSFEEVKATNNNVSAILNTETGEFAALALVKGFRFKVALMEEHFNENYIESSTYPKAVFRGTIVDFVAEDITEEALEYTINGAITLHGETKEISIQGFLKRVNGGMQLSTDFSLRPEDFKIKIPAIVRNKIAEKIDVTAQFVLTN